MTTRRNVILVAAVLAVAFCAWFLLQLLGPYPKIIVSPQTTHITEPLGHDGLPDYEKYVLDLYRDDIRPENNAVVLLWQALGPADLDPDERLAVVTELGLELAPGEAEAMTPLDGDVNRSIVAAWLEERAKRQAGGDVNSGRQASGDPSANAEEGINEPSAAFDVDTMDNMAIELIDDARSRPWKSEQIPPLVEWLAANNEQLDLLVEASARSRFYAPAPTLLNDLPDGLISMHLFDIQRAREVARALSTRAMWHLGEGGFEEAWSNLRALHRWARLVGQGTTLVEQLVAFAISGIANEGTVALLSDERLSAEMARRVQTETMDLERISSITRTIDNSERLMFLDSVIHIVRHGDLGVLSDGEGPSPIATTAIDWNVVLRTGNEWYDRLVAIASLSARDERRIALAQFETDLSGLTAGTITPGRAIGAFFSRSLRSQAMADMFVSLMLPAIGAATTAEDRTNTMLELTQLAAALAVYRAEQNIYAEQLDHLVPGVLEKLPVDVYNSKPYVYKRDGDGYLLYSAGENTVDDGGSHDQWSILNGQFVNKLNATEAEDARSQIPAGADDVSIRVPRAKFELPHFTSLPSER